MTRLEVYLDEGTRSRERHAVWLANRVKQDERDRLCKQEFGFAERAARQRWDVIDLLTQHGVQPSELGDVEPCKLRELAGRRIEGTHDEVLAIMQRHCEQSMTAAQEQGRMRAEVVPSSVVVACASQGPTGWSVALAVERKKGQLLVREMDGLDSCSEAVGVAIGAALMLGRLELTFHGSLDLREQANVRAKLTARDVDVRISPPILPEPPDPRSRWPRFDEVLRGPLARQAAGHLLAVLEGRSTATLPENTHPPVTKEVTAPQRARRAVGRAATK